MDTANDESNPDRPSRPLMNTVAASLNASRRWWTIVGAGYLVVAVFSLGYALAGMFGDGATALDRFALGFILCAPLLAAFLWDRLKSLRWRSLKAFGVEVTLSEATARVASLAGGAPEEALADQQYFSGDEAILRQIGKGLHDPDRQLLEINLRSRPYWWSTRLYLEAALLADHSRVALLVFVEGDEDRRFVGTVRPALLRDALGDAMPCLKTTYRDLAVEDLSIEDLIKGWAVSSFDGRTEQDAMWHVTAQGLRDFLGSRLETTAIRWTGDDGPLMHYKILNRGDRFVPIVRDGRLDRIVDAEALARRWGLATLEGMMT